MLGVSNGASRRCGFRQYQRRNRHLRSAARGERGFAASIRDADFAVQGEPDGGSIPGLRQKNQATPKPIMDKIASPIKQGADIIGQSRPRI
jgi:hypothetical protein